MLRRDQGPTNNLCCRPDNPVVAPKSRFLQMCGNKPSGSGEMKSADLISSQFRRIADLTRDLPARVIKILIVCSGGYHFYIRYICSGPRVVVLQRKTKLTTTSNSVSNFEFVTHYLVFRYIKCKGRASTAIVPISISFHPSTETRAKKCSLNITVQCIIIPTCRGHNLKRHW